jgi:Concanavalin A-like lectin/glucanases superfamily
MAPHVSLWAAATSLWLAAASVGAGCGGHAAAPDAGDGSSRDGLPLDAPPPFDARGAGYALSFDGVNDYATAGNAGFPPAGADQTESLWINFVSASTTQDFLVLRTDFVSGVQIGIHGGTVAVWRTYVERVLVAAPTLPAVGQWHHVAYTFDRTTHTLYIDGVVAATSTAANDIRTPNQVWLGTIDGSGELYKGLMDEVRVWSVVRTAAEIQKDMLHRPPQSEPGLVAYWTFDDAQSGGRSLDMSGGGNDVTLGDGVAERMPSRVLSDAPAVP